MPSHDPLFGNSISGLMDCALDATEPSAEDSWQPPTPEHLSQILPQYRIVSLLGRGGMGAVYKGQQPSLKRPVAIKLLPAEFSANADFMARFQREAQTLVQLNHHGIVAIFDSGTTSEGHLYFVMEYIDGTDLAHLLHTQRLEPDQALELTMQICEALHYAHSQGVVHRDIKPANVLLTRDGRAKLADFGLARPLSALRTRITASHLVMGTPDYMAPEQWQGQADHRADIYALGVMLYEMLTGTKPQGAFDLPSIKAHVDARLDDVIIKAMRQEPERRYQRVSELRHDVDQIRTTHAPQPAVVRLAPAPKQPIRQAPAASSTKSPRKRSSPFEVVMWLLAFALIAALSFVGYQLIISAQPSATKVLGPSTQSSDLGPSISSTSPNIPSPSLAPSAPAPLSLTPKPKIAQATSAPQPSMAPVANLASPSSSSVTGEAKQPCIDILKAQAVNAKEWALASLEETVPNDIRQNLMLLREDLVDEGKANPRAPIAAYSAAWQLCNALLAALDERDKSRVAAGYRAAQANANQTNTNQALEARRNYQMSWPQHAREGDQRSELQRQSGNRVAVAGEAQKVAWNTRSAALRANLDKLYAQFRAAMR